MIVLLSGAVGPIESRLIKRNPGSASKRTFGADRGSNGAPFHTLNCGLAVAGYGIAASCQKPTSRDFAVPPPLRKTEFCADA